MKPQSQPIEGKELEDDHASDLLHLGWRRGHKPTQEDIAAARAGLTKYVQDQLIAELERVLDNIHQGTLEPAIRDRLSELRKERNQ